jgi:hypothetical protein
VLVSGLALVVLLALFAIPRRKRKSGAGRRGARLVEPVPLLENTSHRGIGIASMLALAAFGGAWGLAALAGVLIAVRRRLQMRWLIVAPASWPGSARRRARTPTAGHVGGGVDPRVARGRGVPGGADGRRRRPLPDPRLAAGRQGDPDPAPQAGTRTDPAPTGALLGTPVTHRHPRRPHQPSTPGGECTRTTPGVISSLGTPRRIG